MKKRIYFFSFDTDDGMGTHLHTDKAEFIQEIHAFVELENKALASQMRAEAFESDEWRHLWESFVTDQETACRYYNYGFQDLEILAPTLP